MPESRRRDDSPFPASRSGRRNDFVSGDPGPNVSRFDWLPLVGDDGPAEPTATDDERPESDDPSSAGDSPNSGPDEPAHAGDATVDAAADAASDSTDGPGTADAAITGADGVLETAADEGPETADGTTPETASEGHERSEREPPIDLAESFADAVTDATLDFTAASLSELDELVASRPAAASKEAAPAIGAYLGAVFVRSYGATWTHEDATGWIVELSGPDVEEPTVLALPKILQQCLEGSATFAQFHDAALAEVGRSGPTLAEGDATSSGDRSVPTLAVQKRRDRANRFAQTQQDYDLDFSPASLSELDDLIADVFDRSPDDVDREQRISQSPPGSVPQEASLHVGADDPTSDVAAYVGEVYRRTYDAKWQYGQQLDSLHLDGPGGSVTLEPQVLASAAFDGYVSFERLHDHVVTELDLES